MDLVCEASRCLVTDERINWIEFGIRARHEQRLTRLIQTVKCTALGEVPVAEHHPGLDRFHFALRQSLRLVAV